MCFLAWTLCYSVRVDMSVAIVAMVNTSELYQTKKYMIYSITKLCCLTWSQWRWELITNRNRVCGARRRVTWGTKDFVNNCQGIKIINIYSRLEKKITILALINLQASSDGEFYWDSVQQGYILGGFSYGYVCTQLLGGILAERYGGKWVIGLGTFLSTAAGQVSLFDSLSIN